MPIKREDPSFEILNRIREIQTMKELNPYDGKELAEREEAAERYAGEDEGHFVNFLEDAVKTSRESRREIREAQLQAWAVYNEKEPWFYSNKEPWQSRVIIPKPHYSVQYGAAAVKKAFSPNFLTVKDPSSPFAEAFWQSVLETQLDSEHSNFQLRFTDAVTMALAVGESMEMIPMFRNGRLSFELIEPWKIFRDPDAPSRDPQGGMYWIHQEWLDYYVLQEMGKTGKYFDVARVKDTSDGNTSDPMMSKENIARRKDQVWQRSDFRKMVLTNEFWGTVLSPKGELLLENATYTVAGARVIELPHASPYRRLRFPGISFSPMPSLLSYGGRGLLDGVIRVWFALCDIASLHLDALKWIVNPPMEIDISMLEDPEDVDSFPGKAYLTRGGVHGQQAIRAIDRRDNTNNILANLQYLDQQFQRGSFSTDAIQGLPGYRKDMTWRESEQNLDQSLGVFSLMGANLEAGAIAAIMSAYESIRAYSSFEDYQKMIPSEKWMEFSQQIPMDPEGTPVLPEFTGMMHVSGIQALMKDAETLKNLIQVVVPMATNPRFAKYIQPYWVARAIETRINLSDEKCFVPEVMGKQIQEAELQMMLTAPMQPQPQAEGTQTEGSKP